MFWLLRRLWRRHKAKAAERSEHRDQVHSRGHTMDDAQRMTNQERTSQWLR
jgi:hypothetical protein